MRKKAVFVCCARNSASALDGVLANIARLSNLFAASAILFLENDSRDNTRALIATWCAARTDARQIAVPDLSDNRIRTLCLATVRNLALDLVRTEFSDCDYLVLMDGDEVNAVPLDPEAFGKAIAFLEAEPDRAAVFANSGGAYFDLWALRHPTLCPTDVWEELADYVIANRVSDEEAYRHTLGKRVFALAADAPPLEVDSAFGGLGIYKMSAVLANPARYVGAKTKRIPPHVPGGPAELGWQVCEHVSFHQGLRARGGKLFVLPWLINCSVANAGFPASAWRSFLFDPKAAAPVAAPASRNQPCPCGSGERYKNCHGRLG